MTDFQSIGFQTYNAVQDAITVLENVDQTPYPVSLMGEGLGAAYAARLRELATVDVDGEDGELSYEKIVAVYDQITDMTRVLKWMLGTRWRVEEVEDIHIGEAVSALQNIETVAFE
nr:MAG TPA: hypothetical protein [Caudoviricetes sp.]